MQTDPIWHRDSIGSLKPMQESSRGADHGSDLCLHVSLYAENCLKHVCTLLIGYRSGGTPGFPRNLRARDGIAGRQRGSSACQRPGDLPALRVACRCSPVGFDRQHTLPNDDRSGRHDSKTQMNLHRPLHLYFLKLARLLPLDLYCLFHTSWAEGFPRRSCISKWSACNHCWLELKGGA